MADLVIRRVRRPPTLPESKGLRKTANNVASHWPRWTVDNAMSLPECNSFTYVKDRLWAVTAVNDPPHSRVLLITAGWMPGDVFTVNDRIYDFTMPDDVPDDVNPPVVVAEVFIEDFRRDARAGRETLRRAFRELTDAYTLRDLF